MLYQTSIHHRHLLFELVSLVSQARTLEQNERTKGRKNRTEQRKLEARKKWIKVSRLSVKEHGRANLCFYYSIEWKRN